MEIKIKNKIISEKNACFIIAEAGVNHNGKLGLAKKLIDRAKEAGADAVKFQTWITDEIFTPSYPEYKMLKKLELSYNDFEKLKKYAQKKGIIFLSTPDEEKSADFLEKLNVPAFKIGSGEITNLSYLKHVAKKKKPIILSTGTADLKEIKEAVRTIKKTKNSKLALLHCTTSYPCPIKDVNLRAMLALKKEFKDLLIGYSDHTSGIFVSVMAVSLGASIIEKHFTLNKNFPGPDHKASLDPEELKQMIKAVRDAEKALGSEIKKAVESEKKNREIVRKFITAKIDIPKNSLIKKDMIALKRAGKGLEPKYIKKILGRKAKKEIKKDSLIKIKDLK